MRMKHWMAAGIVGMALHAPAFAQVDGEPMDDMEGGAGIGHAGTNELGGSAYLQWDQFTPEGGDGQSGYRFNVNPAYGRFFTDHFLMRFGLVLGLAGGDLYQGLGSSFGLLFEPLLVGDAGAMFWYVGGIVEFQVIAPDEGDNINVIGLGPQAGLLVPLNDWLALDVGMRILYETADTDPKVTGIHIPFGVLGVRGYF